MKVIESTIRAVVERVTEIEFDQMRLFVFENIGKNGKPCKYWVQNWECDDITDNLTQEEHIKITDFLNEYYKSEATK